MANKSSASDPATPSVDNPGAPLSGSTDPVTDHPPLEAPSGAEADAQAADAEKRAENLGDKVVESELRNPIDPVTGEESPDGINEARGIVSVAPMVPESKGDIRTDVTWPSHVQAPPAAQVAGAPRTASKATSSTSERKRAAQRTSRDKG